MLINNALGALYITQAKQREAELAAERHRVLQLCQQQPNKPHRYSQIVAGLGRLLVLIGTRLEARYQPAGA
ncbi:MAG: hypothetical protein R3A44_24955 [Caldilineaceae bacterium]